MGTIGVAIEIPEPWGTQIQDYRESIGDPMAELIPPHITLVPPVDIAPELMRDIAFHLENAAAMLRPFKVHLHGTATFRPVSPVVFIALTEGISACERLERAVRQGPLGVDLTFPYHPHVTVAHELPEDILDRATADLGGFDATFVVEHFTLYIHDEAKEWIAARSFKLG